MEKHRYYITFRDSENYGSTFMTLPSELDTEEKILALHRRIEQQEGKKVVILDWKRID